MCEHRCGTGDPVLLVAGVGHRTGPAFALGPIDLTVRPGEGVAVIGTNGAGKTTLIRLVAGLLRPHTGEVRIRGVQAHRSRQVSRHVGYVQQVKELPDGVTVEAYVEHQLKLRRAEPGRRDELIEVADLGRYRHQYARRLSGGNQRKVHIICAVAHRPELLILDEPTAGLDPLAREHLLDLLRGLKGHGVGVLFASHHRDELVGLADSVIALHEGHQVREASLGESIRLGARSDLVLEPLDPSTVEQLRCWTAQLAAGHDLIKTVDACDGTVRIGLCGGERAGFLEEVVTRAGHDGVALRAAAYSRPSLADIVRELADNPGAESPS